MKRKFNGIVRIITSHGESDYFALFRNRPVNMELARLAASSREMAEERRQHPRHPASAIALVRSIYGQETESTLVDISLHGCCVRCEASWLKTGSFVAVSLEGEPALQALIRWVRNGAAGMELLGPIPPERTEWHKWLDSPFCA